MKRTPLYPPQTQPLDRGNDYTLDAGRARDRPSFGFLFMLAMIGAVTFALAVAPWVAETIKNLWG